MTRCDLSLGFVGLGALGLPMAINLHRAGFRLKVHTRSRTAETSPELRDAQRCSSPADASDDVDVLLLCVSDDAAVEEVLFGSDGAASKLQAGSVVLDCSTIAPPTAERCAERLARQDVHYLDSPVTGGTEGAQRAASRCWWGSQRAIERVRPILEVIGAAIHHFGAVGRGQQVKAVNQVLVAGSYAAVAEAVVGQQLDLPMQTVIDALKNGAAGSGPGASQHCHAERHVSPRLPAQPAHKDLGIAPNSAEAVQLNLPSRGWWNSWNAISLTTAMAMRTSLPCIAGTLRCRRASCC